MSSSPSSGRSFARRRIFVGVAVVFVVAITLVPRQMAAPMRTIFMDLARIVFAPVVDEMTYVQLESTLNALLFVPFGAAFAILLSRRLWVLSPVLAIGSSWIIEQLQAVIPGRVPDVHDILWNAVGGIIGALMVGLVREVRRSTRLRSESGGESNAQRVGVPTESASTLVDHSRSIYADWNRGSRGDCGG